MPAVLVAIRERGVASRGRSAPARRCAARRRGGAARRAARPRRRRDAAARRSVRKLPAAMASLDREDRRQRLVVDPDRGRRRARACSSRLGDHPRDGLAGEAHLGREQRLVVSRRTDVVLAGHVVGGEHGEHARRARGRAAASIDSDTRVRVRRLHRPRVRDVRHVGPQIVDVARRAGDVADAPIRAAGRADDGRGRDRPTGWFIGPPPPARLRAPCRRRTSRAAGRSSRADTRRCRAGRSSACRRRRRSTAAPPTVSGVHGWPISALLERGRADRRRGDAAVGDPRAAPRVRPASGRARTRRRPSRCRRGCACSPCRSAGSPARRAARARRSSLRPAAPRSCGRRGRTRAAARRARPAALASVTDASSASSTGGPSPIGDAVMRLPPSVARLRISRDENSGRSCAEQRHGGLGRRVQVLLDLGQRQAGAEHDRVGRHREGAQLGQRRERDDHRMAIALLRDADHDVGAAGDQRRGRRLARGSGTDRRGWSAGRTARRRARCRRASAAAPARRAPPGADRRRPAPAASARRRRSAGSRCSGTGCR